MSSTTPSPLPDVLPPPTDTPQSQDLEQVGENDLPEADKQLSKDENEEKSTENTKDKEAQ